MWTGKFQHWGTITGRFMTALMITLQMTVSIPAFNIPPSNFDGRPNPHKIARYTPYLLPSAISVSPDNYFRSLTTPYDSPDLIPYDNPKSLPVMKKDVPILGRVIILFCCRKHDKKDSTKRQGSITPHAMRRTINVIIVMGFPRSI